MTDAISKSELFRRLGYGGSFDLLELVLEEAGLSRPSKPNISPDKVASVSALLAERFVPVCGRGDCKEEAAEPGGDRIAVPASAPAHCGICQGSSNARAVDEMVRALRGAGLGRLCVVGGSPNTRTMFQHLVGNRLELRLVDGVSMRTASQARTDLAWADVVAIWGGTELDHKVSLLYKGPNVIQLARRSIRDLASEVAASVKGGAERRGFRR